MPVLKNQSSPALADSVIKELGGLTSVAKICKVKPSSVAYWAKHGLPSSREMYLRLKFSKLDAWKQARA